MKKINPDLHERLMALIGSMGYELVGCEAVPQGRQMVFRIYIDSPKGVTIDDCSLVSHQVSAMLDVDGPFQGRYSLEVSSPGIDRPLFTPAQYHRFIGSRVKVKLHSPIERRKQYKGILVGIEGENIRLLVEDTGLEVILPFSLIEKANVVGEIRL